MTVEEYGAVFLEMPEPEAKQLWVRDFHMMITHTRGGMSERLIKTRRPNESQAIFDYRIANDRAVTRNAFMKAITNLQRTLSHSSVEVRYPDLVKGYLEQPNFDDTDFMSYMQRKVVKYMCEAANAFLVWWPENVGNITEQVAMVPYIVMPELVKHYNKEVFTWLSHEKSLVTVGETEKMEGEVYWTILKEGLFKVVQYGKKSEKTYRIDPYYANSAGDIYALPLGGDWTTEETKDGPIGYYTSYLSSAVPFADECKVQFSDHQGVMVNCAFPLREVEALPCSNHDCKDGYIRGPKGEKMTCGACDGTGRMPINPGPHGIFVRPKRQTGVGEKDSTDIPMMRFIYPDPSILKFGSESWESFLDKTEDALNLLFLDEAQSGIAKNIDREDKLAWLDKVAVNVYKYLVVMSVQIIAKFRFPAQDFPEVYVLLPSTFVIKSESQYIEDISMLRKSSMPDMLLIEKTREFISKTFGGDPVRLKMWDVLIYIDPLAINTPQEKAQMFASGAISQSELQFSNQAAAVIATYARENDDFALMTVEQIAEAVIPLIEKRITRMSEINPRIIG